MKAFRVVAPLVVPFLLVLSAAFSALPGLLAAAIGTVGTGLFLYGTWLIVQTAGAAASSGRPSPRQAVIVALALLLKLPLIYAGWVLAQGLGPFGPTWFLAGLGSVYCLVIWRAVLAVRA